MDFAKLMEALQEQTNPDSRLPEVTVSYKCSPEEGSETKIQGHTSAVATALVMLMSQSYACSNLPEHIVLGLHEMIGELAISRYKEIIQNKEEK